MNKDFIFRWIHKISRLLGIIFVLYGIFDFLFLFALSPSIIKIVDLISYTLLLIVGAALLYVAHLTKGSVASNTADITEGSAGTNKRKILKTILYVLATGSLLIASVFLFEIFTYSSPGIGRIVPGFLGSIFISLGLFFLFFAMFIFEKTKPENNDLILKRQKILIFILIVVVFLSLVHISFNF